MKITFLLLAQLILNCVVLGQSDSIADNRKMIRKITYNAYLSGVMNIWEQGIRQAKEQYIGSKNQDDRFELALTLYGVLNATMKDKDKDIFEKYVDVTVDHLESMIESKYKLAECKALLSAIYGLKIAYTPWMGMFYGPKSDILIEDAMEIDSRSPLVQKLYGNSKYFTPEMWGGNPDDAILAYREAIRLFEEGDISNDWLYLDTFAWLGSAMSKQGDKEKAREVFTRALELEPDYNWVKYALLPDLDKTN